MTDSRNFIYPKSKTGKSWHYDISDGTVITDGIKLNTPLAMIVLGTYIASMDILELLKDTRVYFISFIKLLLPIYSSLSDNPLKFPF